MNLFRHENNVAQRLPRENQGVARLWYDDDDESSSDEEETIDCSYFDFFAGSDSDDDSLSLPGGMDEMGRTLYFDVSRRRRTTELGRALKAGNAGLKLIQDLVDREMQTYASKQMIPSRSRHPLNRPAADGRLPLHLACANGNKAIIQFLASAYPKAIAKTDDDEMFPLHIACAQCDKDTIHYLRSRHPQALVRADSVGRLPIHIACTVGDKDVIDYLATARPKTLTKPDYRGKLPIHVACSLDDQEDIIDYLAYTCPHSLATSDYKGKLPIDVVLDRRSYKKKGPSLATIQRMITLCPESLLVVNQTTAIKSTALQRLLFRDHVELGLLQTMVETLPTTRGIAVAANFRWVETIATAVTAPGIVIAPDDPTTADGLTITRDIAVELAKLFWKVESLELQAKAWTQGAFCHFMGQLASAPATFRKLSLSLPSYAMSTRPSKTRVAFERALMHNTHISDLRFDVCQDDRLSNNKDGLLLQALVRGVQRRSTRQCLDRLELANFSFPKLGELVCHVSRSLVLRGIQVRGVGRHKPSGEDGEPRLEELTIHRGSGMTGASCRNVVLGMRQSFGHLRRLDVDWDFDPRNNDNAEAGKTCLEHPHRLLPFLREASRLESLTMRGCRMDPADIVQALKENHSIRTLRLVPRTEYPVLKVDDGFVELLERHNASLADINPLQQSSNVETQAKFDYWLGMNKYGRAKIRDEGCNADSFLRAISMVPSGEMAILYGLLLERPELWSRGFATQ
ncbi:Ankyrin Repeat [Seminavis robusta]|uniref:Ankyrin Repeat n=1 Tax=Seminavis robusta TaxID=568900 RepID=A0A9N8HJY8_9STRA|nr:Ankyrin Repeat [Seminavis robusta]|eukprot:Sro898_g217670.1 Ankyrin Repeat (743) ;mRNA; r:37519-39747